ncbi:15421_t:CDS:1, partial [Funneliformis geosporum]
YDFTIKHRPGVKNQNANTFSQIVSVNMALTEENEEEDNQWIQVHFSALNVSGCQTIWQ